MLTTIHIRGFKSLVDVEVELGRVNVFVGANGSGKTNLLEAVLFPLATPVWGLCSQKSEDESAHKQVIDATILLKQGARPTVVPFSSFDGDSNEKIFVSYGFGGISHEFTYEEKVLETQSWVESESTREIKRTKIRTTSNTPPWDPTFPKFLSQYRIHAPNTQTLRGISPDLTQHTPVGVYGGRLAEAVEELLDSENDLFGTMDLDDLYDLLDWVEGIDIVPPSRDLLAENVPTLRSIIRFTDRWMHEEKNRFSAYEASEGALYVLFALVLAMHPDTPPLFAIDNFDQAMHPRLARATMRAFCKELLKNENPPRQALLTTHNPLVLDGLDLSDDRIRLFAVERNSQGATQVHRVQVSEKVLKASAEGGEGLSLSQLWLMGRLGGVPNIF